MHFAQLQEKSLARLPLRGPFRTFTYTRNFYRTQKNASREKKARERRVDEAATKKAEDEASRGWYPPCATKKEQQRAYRDALVTQKGEKEIETVVERERELSVGNAMLGYSRAAALAFNVKTN